MVADEAAAMTGEAMMKWLTGCVMFVAAMPCLDALACRGAMWHRAILLDQIPADAEASPFIARVVITKLEQFQTDNPPTNNIAYAEVSEGIRGSKSGDMVRIDVSPTSCGPWMYKDDIGKQGFIAGRSENGFFIGSWTAIQRGLYPHLQNKH